jgi:phosphoserine aminotransferase
MLTSLLEIPANYEILFVYGGESGQFSAVVMKLVAVWVETRKRQAEKELAGDEEKSLERVRKEVREELRLDYLITGSWSLKASQEAARLLEPLGTDLVNVAVDSRKANGGKFGTILEEETWSLSPTRAEGGRRSAFVYYCDNETVDGAEFPELPQCLESASGNADNDGLIVADMSSNFLSKRVDLWMSANMP